jgi:DNA-binding CsgD family transcriptional regulator/uncharacterized coiled-coil protein SlyX
MVEELLGRKRTVPELQTPAKSTRSLVKVLPLAPEKQLGFWDTRFIPSNKTGEPWKPVSYFSPRFKEFLGYNPKDPLTYDDWKALIHPDDVATVFQAIEEHTRNRRPYDIEYSMRLTTGEYRRFHVRGQAVWDNDGNKVRMAGWLAIVSDVGDCDQALRDRVTSLEDRVTEFLTEVERVNDILGRQAVELDAANTALNLLLNCRSQELTTAEERVLTNLKELVLPPLGRLRQLCPQEGQHSLIDSIEQSLLDAASPLLSRLTSGFFGLSQQELRVAKFIRDGKISKEIASLLNISENVVKTHRAHIRRKLKLQRRKLNLREFLVKLSDG